jgi:preprotein translocase subunit SecE
MAKVTAPQPGKPETRAKSLGKRTKDTFGELKKVNWPSFKTVVKNTGVVLLVVVAFTVVIFGADMLFTFLYNLLVGNPLNPFGK